MSDWPQRLPLIEFLMNRLTSHKTGLNAFESELNTRVIDVKGEPDAIKFRKCVNNSNDLEFNVIAAHMNSVQDELRQKQAISAAKHKKKLWKKAYDRKLPDGRKYETDMKVRYKAKNVWLPKTGCVVIGGFHKSTGYALLYDGLKQYVTSSPIEFLEIADTNEPIICTTNLLPRLTKKNMSDTKNKKTTPEPVKDKSLSLIHI